MSAVDLTHAHRTLYESKGLEFNDVGPIVPHIHLIADETKVLLYNFFEDSTATPNQWRLVLNGVPNADNLSDAPTFDETRHASVCVEVRCLRTEVFFPSPLTPSTLAVEVLVRCSYPGSEQTLDHGQFRVS